MAKAIQKITLNAGRDIPFDKLILSQQNVRKTKAGVSIEELAEDIAHRGLLTSLNVRAEVDADGNETDIYRVPAGGRRYRALELLVNQKKLSKTAGIPCIVSKGKTLEAEDSLAENVTRVDLHPLDEFRAIMTLREQGLDEEEIAARFHMSVATVKQRLRLASVSPRLLELYANDEMKLGQVMAFSITNDHVRQEQVWDTISRSHNQDAYYIRRMLTETAVRASDRRTVYVGVEVYEAAGGVVMRDLFEQDNGGWLQDPALLEQLVLEKLTADVEALKVDEGWKWVDAAFDFPYGHTAGLRRFYGERAEYTEDELARHDALKAEYDKLDAEYAAANEYSEETEARLEELGNQLDALNDRPYVLDPEEVARGGAFVSLGANGELKIERGFVRPEDEPVVEPDGDDDSDGVGGNGDAAVAAPANGGISINGKPVGVEEEEEDDGKIRPLSDRLIEDLTAARTVALRNALANDPVMAFIAALHAAVLKIFYRYGSGSCLEITLQHTAFSQTQGLGDSVWAKETEQRQESWGYDLPGNADEVWDYLIALDQDSRMALFAHCVSLTLNATIQPWNRRAKENFHAKQLARSLGFGMVEAGWAPTVDYLGRVTKAHILQAVREAKGEQSAQLIDHLKKPDMAREAARLLEGSGWLPEVLRLPIDEIAAEGNADAAAGNEVAEDDTAESSDVDLPAFLMEGEQVVEAAGEPVDDDNEHLEAAE
jgi:ParB family chromosome partitioning protein